uniref:DUF4371 domain-containing protein n=1 Tax=Nicotiana tabacum TaxID=4097 RepID=A0A1S4AGY1_TOBAC|nr:PREDICTED: uncharacterized protein LOC107797485 [Nicotiana tabacum]
MKRYYPTTSKIPKSSSTSQDLSNLEEIANESKQHQQSERVNLGSLEVDPGERLAIRKYHPNDRDAIRRTYLQRGAFQPREHKFPQRNFYGKLRRFNPQWFSEYDWSEYSVTKNAAFCFFCYLSQDECINQGGGDYVDRRGSVMERFIGIVHVRETTALCLKNGIVGLLAQHSLSPSSICGQCYNGASNMQGDINGLKILMQKESKGAHSIHYFAHQLQLTLVAVSKRCDKVQEFLLNKAEVGR